MLGEASGAMEMIKESTTLRRNEEFNVYVEDEGLKHSTEDIEVLALEVEIDADLPSCQAPLLL